MEGGQVTEKGERRGSGLERVCDGKVVMKGEKQR